MTPAMDPVAMFLEARCRDGSWPGAVWVVEERGRVLSSDAVGLRCLVPDRRPALPDTIYDLASLTKPLATAALLALLEEDGKLALEAPVASIFPGLACARDGRPTLLDLALHRSGLPAWRPLWAFAENREEVLNRIVNLRPEAPCGAKVIYSDPGYILLGEAVRRIAGKDLDALFHDRIAAPLGLNTLVFRPPAALKDRIAPTEMGSRYERELARTVIPVQDGGEARHGNLGEGSLHSEAMGPRAGLTHGVAHHGNPREDSRHSEAVGLRAGLIHGEVHDGNAWALGGAAGHAGLFGTAREVACLAREFLGAGTGLFGARALGRFRENLTAGLEQGRTLGWKRALAGAREAEGVLPAEAFGHNGFTGTSVWLDPLAGRSYVLLTNRVHPEVRPIDMNLLRRGFHEVASRL